MENAGCQVFGLESPQAKNFGKGGAWVGDYGKLNPINNR
jgi:hypothetical protein